MLMTALHSCSVCLSISISALTNGMNSKMGVLAVPSESPLVISLFASRQQDRPSQTEVICLSGYRNVSYVASLYTLRCWGY
jgi:hypothetical protein